MEEQYGGEEEVCQQEIFIQIFIFFSWFLSLCLPAYVQQLPQTNPGFNNTPFKFTKYSNAYMLVYIRESDKEKVICNVDEKDIAEHLRVSHHLFSCFMVVYLGKLKLEALCHLSDTVKERARRERA